MKFNLAAARRLSPDTGPYKALTEAQLALLIDGDQDTVGITVTGETLAVTCTLGARYRLDALYYYHQAATVENLAFYGKQGASSDYPWISFTSTDDGQKVTVDLGSLSDRYEFIRVVHTVVTGSATVYELEIFSDDTEVNFGETGEAVIFSVDSGTSTLLAEEVPIYNRGTVSQSFYCLLDAEDTDSSGLQLGASASGVFWGFHDKGIFIPDSLAWSSGDFSSTVVVSGTVVLASGTSGYYYTPVIDISSLEGRRFFWEFSTSGTNEIDDSTSTDSLATVGVRFSNTAPTDGGWASGQMSTDSNWDTTSGTLDFEPYDNDHILNPSYTNYFQARVEFLGNETAPILEKIGIEEALKVNVPATSSEPVYVKSTYIDHIYGRDSKLVVWFFESRNEEQ